MDYAANMKVQDHMTDNAPLPPRVTHVKVGIETYTWWTAHFPKRRDVRTTVEESTGRHLRRVVQPPPGDDAEWWRRWISSGDPPAKAVFLLAQLIMSSFYRRLGEKLGVQTGAEMLEGIHLAEQTGATLVLADRDIDITLKRVWGYLGFWSKLMLAAELMTSILLTERINADIIEQLKKQDQLEAIMAEFARHFPQIKRRLIDERDTYLAQKIRTAPGKTVVAVIGAGHVEGIRSQIHQDQSLDELTKLPPKAIWPKVVGWGIPLLIVGLIAWSFTKGTNRGIENIYIWILVTGGFAAVGAALALAHPLTIFSAFCAAPITLLHPLLGVGWVAGIVQAFFKRPKVSDLEDLPEAIGSVKGFWTNPVTRILLIILLSSVGAIIGAAIATPWIAARSV
jgi:pheromone shutdown-related protein TraB